MTGAANTAVASLAEGYTPEETISNVAQYANSDLVRRDFALGVLAGAGSTALEKAFTPATQTVKTIKSVNPAPAVDVIPRGGPSPRISGFAQITANVLSDVPYLYPAFDSEISETGPSVRVVLCVLRRYSLVLNNRAIKGCLFYLLVVSAVSFISIGCEIFVYHKSLEYGMKLMALYAIGIVILPVIYFLSLPLFRWLDQLESRVRNFILRKRD